MTDIFTIKIGGAAGQGIKMAGLIMARVAVRSGYHVYTHTEFGSLIHGGHNCLQINISPREVTAPRQKTDLLIALNQETINLHRGELAAGSGVIFDDAAKIDVSGIGEGINIYPVPLASLARDSGGSGLVSNTVALGAVLALISGDLETLKKLIAEKFKGDLVKVNLQAAQLGYDFILKNFSNGIKELIKTKKSGTRMVVNGNEAVSLGAVVAGLKFASVYPMSPTSGILTVLASMQQKFGFIYKQPEDEISAVNMAIGASFAGARSMTATSGGGFCLMTEAYGLAGITETPLVIIEGMRGGPATGLPTWSEQGDLRFVLHAHQGDFPRIVLAPGDAKETFNLTRQAFNLADKYQTPVVVLIDKNICECDQSFDPFDLAQGHRERGRIDEPFDVSSYIIDRGKFTTELQPNYERYAEAKDGISVRSAPGSGNFFIANSDEHDATGFSTEEIVDRGEQMNKRMSKLKTCADADMPAPQLFGPKEADLTIVSWGSNKGSIIEALRSLKSVNYLHITWMNPFPAEAVKEILSRSKYIVDVEANYSGQLAGLIREKTGIAITDKLLKYDGRPFYPEEIIEKIEGIIKK